jgi:transcriptional regulator with XRE-family HTH domain
LQHLSVAGVTIGQRFFEIRRKAGATQHEFAAKLGVSQSALVTYESGHRDPPASAIVEVCRHYAVRPEWVVLGTGVPYADSEIEPLKRAFAIADHWLPQSGLKYTKADEQEFVLLVYRYLMENGNISDQMAESLATRRVSGER